MTDRETARHFLRLAFEPGDWVAVFLKAYDTGRVMQRVAPLATVCEPRRQTWLRVMNAYRFNVYVSVNAMTPGLRERTKHAVRSVRHVFLDVDEDAEGLVERLATRHDLPAPSYVVHSSAGRLQMAWRVRGFTGDTVERLQKQLAKELGADLNATASSQTMRVPGFLNRKHAPAPIVTVEYRAASAVYGPGDFPTPAEPPGRARERLAPARLASAVDPNIVERARRYLAAVPPAVAGQHGDTQTFRVCCRLERALRAALVRAGVDREAGARAPLRAGADRRPAGERDEARPFTLSFVDHARATRPCVHPVRQRPQDPGEHSRCRRPRPSAVLEDTVAKEKGNVVSVKAVRAEQGGPSGKLADAELIFEAGAGPLSGLRLIGFAVWERRDGGKNVTFPARPAILDSRRVQPPRASVLTRSSTPEAAALRAPASGSFVRVAHRGNRPPGNDHGASRRTGNGLRSPSLCPSPSRARDRRLHDVRAGP
ncbi:MAG TPA: DNA-primase RepB domain-containing protein [Vicinamibacterales bacterium]|jgi:hypothetical protein